MHISRSCVRKRLSSTQNGSSHFLDSAAFRNGYQKEEEEEEKGKFVCLFVRLFVRLFILSLFLFHTFHFSIVLLSFSFLHSRLHPFSHFDFWKQKKKNLPFFSTRLLRFWAFVFVRYDCAALLFLFFVIPLRARIFFILFPNTVSLSSSGTPSKSFN